MTHADFAQEVLKEWNLTPEQMNQSCYGCWYNYTIPSGKTFPKNRFIGQYTLRKGKVVFVLAKQDGTEQVWEAK
ncbi:MAG: hypothetical protein K5651_07140 [Bacteroidales bacterium]|nr:hypothetical protein [Bacteroidales bacterium]